MDNHPVTYEYKYLLNRLSENPGREAEMHDFLAQRPSLLPGLFGVDENAHHGVINGVVFYKLPLQGTFKRVPDFLFVTKTSIRMQIVFIEIEDPAINMFNKDDSFTKEFNHAFQQLEDWHSWFSHGGNQTILLQTLQTALRWTYMFETPVQPIYLLIMGRRQEFENNQNRKRRLDTKSRHPYYVLSFDRLQHCSKLDNLIVVKHAPNGFEAIEVNDFYEYDYRTRQSHGHIAGKKNAVLKNKYMGDMTKAKLLQNIDYWDNIPDDKLIDHIFKTMNRGG